METNSIPLSPAEPILQDKSQNLLLQILKGFFYIFQTVILPHLLLAFILLLLTGYTTYRFVFHLTFLPNGFLIFLFIVLLLLYAFLAFGYLFLTTGICALRRACVSWEEFIESLFERIQENALGQLNRLQDSMPKEQAKVLVTGSIRHVVGGLKPQSLPALSRWLAAFTLGCLTLALRGVMIAKIIKFSGKTIQIGKLFAGRATLAGAVFLNLRFFSTLLLGILYLIGLIVFVLNLRMLWG